MDDKVRRQKEHFDSIALHYGESRQHRNHLQLKKLIWANFFATNRLPKVDSLNVLEAMCGYADGKAILEEHLKCKINYSGFDYSDTVVDKLREDQPDIEVWQQDVTQFESPTRYDVIVILGGLHHVPHAAGDVVKRLAGNLRPGGFFINLEPTHGNGLYKLARERIYARNPLFDEQTERAFAVDELYAMFSAAGLERVDATYPGLLSYVMYYNPDAFPLLNIGPPSLVRALFALERPFLRTRLARWLSFATLSLWQRP